MVRRYFHDPMFSRFGKIPACDGWTDSRTDRQTHDDSIYRPSIASRGKNVHNINSNQILHSDKHH